MASVELEILVKLFLLCVSRIRSTHFLENPTMQSYQIRQLQLGGVLDQALSLTGIPQMD